MSVIGTALLGMPGSRCWPRNWFAASGSFWCRPIREPTGCQTRGGVAAVQDRRAETVQLADKS